MKKRFLITTLLGVAAICGGLSLVACGGDAPKDDGNKPAAVHNHSYAATWSKEDYSHWHECKGDVSGAKCDAPIKDKAYHVDANEDDKCDTCFAALTYSKDLEYMFLGDSYALLNIGKCKDTNVIVPPTYKGYPVTHIGDLHDDRPVKGFNTLTSIVLPDSVIAVTATVFTECTSLKYNEYDNALYLGNDSNPYLVLVKKADNMILSCDINENTKVIANSAFSGCGELTDVVMPDSVKYIGTEAFAYCDKLKYNEFDNAKYLGSAANPYRVLITAKNGSIKTCVVHEDTEVIATYAFGAKNIYNGYGCISLTSLTLNEKVRYIGEKAFVSCTSLTEITIPASVTFLGMGAFYNCSKLTNINVSPDSADFTSVNGVLYNTDKTTLLAVPRGMKGEFVIPNSVTFVGAMALDGCHWLTNVVIPDSVVCLGYESFANLGRANGSEVTLINDIVLPDSVQKIGGAAFLYCFVRRITISKSIDYIEWYTFRFCEFLREITIPDGVKVVGSYAFNGCLSLATINLPDTIEVIDSAFGGTAVRKITIPVSLKSMNSAFFSNEYLDEVTYKGTKTQWEEIIKNSMWNNDIGRRPDAVCIIRCTDGDIEQKKHP